MFDCNVFPSLSYFTCSVSTVVFLLRRFVNYSRKPYIDLAKVNSAEEVHQLQQKALHWVQRTTLLQHSVCLFNKCSVGIGSR